MSPVTRLQELTQAAYAADKVWSDMLHAMFGKRAGDARYDERGRSTPELRAARAAMHEATEAMHQEWRKTLIYPHGA